MSGNEWSAKLDRYRTKAADAGFATQDADEIFDGIERLFSEATALLNAELQVMTVERDQLIAQRDATRVYLGGTPVSTMLDGDSEVITLDKIARVITTRYEDMKIQGIKEIRTFITVPGRVGPSGLSGIGLKAAKDLSDINDPKYPPPVGESAVSKAVTQEWGFTQEELRVMYAKVTALYGGLVA